MAPRIACFFCDSIFTAGSLAQAASSVSYRDPVDRLLSTYVAARGMDTARGEHSINLNMNSPPAVAC